MSDQGEQPPLDGQPHNEGSGNAGNPDGHEEEMDVDAPPPGQAEENVFGKAKAAGTKCEKFDTNKHSQAVPEYLLQVSLALTLMAVVKAHWGIYLLTLLPMPILRLVLVQLGLTVEMTPDPVTCTWEAVTKALKAVCCVAEDSDQGRLYAVQRYKVQDAISGRYKKLLEDVEQLYLQMTEPLGTQSKVF